MTDDERREVAERLRECKSNVDSVGWFWLNDALGGAHLVASSEERLRRGTDLLADLIEPDEPPCNLYSLYEVVFRRRPRDKYVIEDDEVDELVDALLDICNMPGHEHIQRSGPAHPDAMASYKGWRSEVYDPDGVLVSPSNVAADLVRAHADGKTRHSTKEEQNEYSAMLKKMSVEMHPVDRDALLELADRMEHMAGMGALLAAHGLAMAAASIREALGVES